MTIKRKMAMVLAVMTIATTLMTGIASAHIVCDPGWQFDITSRKVNQISTGSAGQAAETFSNYNGSSTSAKATFTSTKSTTTSESFTAGVSGGTGPALSMFWSVQAKVEGNITHSRSNGLGVSQDVTVPSHKYGNGRYGSWRVWVTGNSYYLTSYCNETNHKDGVTYKVPINASGWCVWISTVPAAQAPSQCAG